MKTLSEIDNEDLSDLKQIADESGRTVDSVVNEALVRLAASVLKTKRAEVA